MAQSIRRDRRHSLVYPALLGLGASVLASCAASQPPPSVQTSAVRPLPPRPEVPTVPSVAPRPARKPTPPPPAGTAALTPDEEGYATARPKPTEGGAGAAPSAPSPNVAAVSPTNPASGHNPSQVELIGLDEPSATRLFGPATEKADAPPATVWRYKTASCELDLFFYLDLSSGRMRTLHYAFKGDGTDMAKRQDCLTSLLVARGG